MNNTGSKWLTVLPAMALSMATNAEIMVYQPDEYHGTDVWVTSYYDYGDDYGVNDGKLQAGGWYDWYYILIQFDVNGLPPSSTINSVELWMMSYPRGDLSTPVDMHLDVNTEQWARDLTQEYASQTQFEGESISWSEQPASSEVVTIPQPAPPGWYVVNITDIYNAWKDTPATNFGLKLRPVGNINQFSMFRSSDWSTSSERPMLVIDYTPAVASPDFKLPLPGGKSWLVTNEIGSGDCLAPNANLDLAHVLDKYFALDFDDTSAEVGQETDVNIHAAAGGRVVVVGTNANDSNGYHVAIDHDGDGALSTGYQTWYGHMKRRPKVKLDQLISQGALLGVVGNTGTSTGTHLHFAVKYQNSAYQYIPELASVKIEGRYLKNYVTECTGPGGIGGTPDGYYPSSNTP